MSNQHKRCTIQGRTGKLGQAPWFASVLPEVVLAAASWMVKVATDPLVSFLARLASTEKLMVHRLMSVCAPQLDVAETTMHLLHVPVTVSFLVYVGPY